jgi:multicomponent Na+:H+ antiporter subunit B
MRLDIILRIGAKLFLPFILLFALYVQFHGDYGPGGGFQAGVIAAAMVIFYAVIFGSPAAKKIVPPLIVEIMIPLGVFIFAGVGVVTIVLGGNYLEYTVLAQEQKYAQEWGILLVEIGVFVTVAGTLTAIFYLLAGRGR